jgi:regulator of replication initiation timing
MGDLDKYMIQLRRELTRSQARLSRAERQRDRLMEENTNLRQRLAEAAAKAKRPRKSSNK